MAERVYRQPAIAWLKITDYIHGWLTWELGGAVRVNGQPVICVQNLKGARELLRMETTDDVEMQPRQVGSSVSATRYNVIEAGLRVGGDAVVRQMYGIGREELELYMPVECPRRCLTQDGVVRPWTNDVAFGDRQATALQRLIRDEFFQAVSEFDHDYAMWHKGEKYPAIDMIEYFCKETGTSDIHAETIRREWQRRVKRTK